MPQIVLFLTAIVITPNRTAEKLLSNKATRPNMNVHDFGGLRKITALNKSNCPIIVHCQAQNAYTGPDNIGTEKGL